MSEAYSAENATSANETAANTPYEAAGGPEPADNPRSYPDAAPEDGFAGYSDADIDAVLAAEDQLPEPRSRQETAATTWDGAPDNPADSDQGTGYDGDVAALLAEEEHLPEPRTRPEAAAAALDDTNQPGDDGPASFSGDPASEYDGDVTAFLAAEDQLPEPRSRQEAAATTWDSATRTSPRPPDADQTASPPDEGLRPVSPDEPTAEDRARLHQLYEEYLKEQESGRDQGANVVGDKPTRSPGDISDLPPPGDELVEMEDDAASHLEKLRRTIYEEAEDISDVADNYGGTLGQLFERPPTETHTEVPVSPHSLPSHQEHGVDGGHLATAGLVVGVLGFELFHAINNRVRAWRER